MEHQMEDSESAVQTVQAARLSFKFERLRERLRDAIVAGEFKGRLPGERQLAARFRVNAKTLSKALTDLAAEGLLDRRVGRGTYVRGADSGPVTKPSRWLVLTSPDSACPLWSALSARFPDSMLQPVDRSLRPSQLHGFDVVLDAAQSPPDSAMLRDLVVRNIPVVSLDKAPGLVSTHSVAVDTGLAGWQLGRRAVEAGHRRLAVLETDEAQSLYHGVVSAARERHDVHVRPIRLADLPEVVRGDHASTAVVCGTTELARRAMTLLATESGVGKSISVSAAGIADGPLPCVGYFVSVDRMIEAIESVAVDGYSRGPIHLWLSGQYDEPIESLDTGRRGQSG
jgi:hypothetical protein